MVLASEKISGVARDAAVSTTTPALARSSEHVDMEDAAASSTTASLQVTRSQEEAAAAGVGREAASSNAPPALLLAELGEQVVVWSAPTLAEPGKRLRRKVTVRSSEVLVVADAAL